MKTYSTERGSGYEIEQRILPSDPSPRVTVEPASRSLSIVHFALGSARRSYSVVLNSGAMRELATALENVADSLVQT